MTRGNWGKIASHANGRTYLIRAYLVLDEPQVSLYSFLDNPFGMQ